MANLAKLHANMQAKPDFTGMVDAAVEKAVRRISSGITDNVKAHTATTEQRQASNILDVVTAITPAIQEAIESGISSVLADIGKIEKLDDLKGMVGGIKIPDYSEHLGRIEKTVNGTVKKIPKTDLAPIMSQLATISEQLSEPSDDKKEWTFDVKRDSVTKLIDKVEVT